MVCFVHFDFEMCFAPQRRALFRHRNFQKGSGAEVFCTFWLGNVLRATTACTFLTSQLPKVVRDRQFLTLLTSKCASHHNGVQFFIAPVASWLRTRRFSEPTFRPSGATNHWKNTVFRDFPTFSRICIFCLLTLSLLIFSLLIFLFSLPLPCSAFHLSILSEVWLLNFLRKAKLILRYWTLWHTGHLSPCLWSHPELDFGTGRTGAGFGAVSEDVWQGMDWGLFSHHPLSGLGATGATGATGYWDLGGDRCWNTTGGKRSCEVFRCCKLIIKLVWGLWGVGAWIHRKP